jgi:cytoskeletal protein RodZ
MRSLKLPTYHQGEKSIPVDSAHLKTSTESIDLEPRELSAPQPSDRLQHIGAQLRSLREKQALSIEEVSARTQIQPRLIEAIESAQIEILPESVYVKGMVKRYGDQMGLNGSALVEDFPIWERQSSEPTPPKDSRRTTLVIPTRVKPLHFYLGYTVVVLAGIAGMSQVLNNTFKPKSPAPILTTELPPLAQSVVEAVQPSALPLPPKLTIAVEIKSPALVKVLVDGKPKFSGNLKVGEKHTWGAQQQVTIETNNAGGILLSRDGHPAQLLGQPNRQQQAIFQVTRSAQGAGSRE